MRAFADATWPTPPEGFEPVTPMRPMRQVLRGSLVGPDGPLAVAVKWFRPVTASDRIARTLRGGKAAREKRGLELLREAGVQTPRALAACDDPVDLLVTEWVDELQPVAEPDAASPQVVSAFARMVAQMHAQGVDHRDLTGKNVAWHADAPFVVDAGGVRGGDPLSARGRATALARLANGWLSEAPRGVRLRALRSYVRAWGRAELRPVDRLVRRRARKLRRTFLAGRDRRPTRAGRHFAVFAHPPIQRGIRAALITTDAWEPLAASWLAADPAEATPLKSDARVLALTGPDERRLVLKRFDAVAPGRLPRPLRAFRVGEAMRYRHLPVPRPLLAAAGGDGSGIVLTEHIDAPNLHAFVHEGRLAALSRTSRARLLRQLGRTIRLMHDAEVSHRDLKAPNLLVRVDDAGHRIVIADLDGARIRRRPISWRRRARDLARLDASLRASRADRLRVLQGYLRVPPWPRLDVRRLLSAIAERVAWKRGPSDEPR